MSHYKKSSPFLATLTQKERITPSGSSKETLHLEISLKTKHAPLLFEPGDSIAIFPQNDPDLIRQILAHLNIDHNASIDNASLFKLLQATYDIASLRKSFLKKYQGIASNARLQHLLDAPSETLQSYLQHKDFLDVIQEFPFPLTPLQLITMLPKLQPRLYSIASSLKAYPEAVHLIINIVRYTAHQRIRKGVASTYIADVLQVGDSLTIYPCTNKHFKLPENNAPLIMIGPGTGIAPFRSFLQELSHASFRNPTWLFFGEQHESTGFYYEKDWNTYLQNGTLTRLTTAFSRDQEQKIYVQHRLWEHAETLVEWLDKGAYLYICGNAQTMAPEVHQALLDILTHDKKDSASAHTYLENLKTEGRYQRDVY